MLRNRLWLVFVYAEIGSLAVLHAEIVEAGSSLERSYEVISVNDRSDDG
jgi:hypothetical protein